MKIFSGSCKSLWLASHIELGLFLKGILLGDDLSDLIEKEQGRSIFENTDDSASMCEKTDTNRLKPGFLVMIKGNPCKVTDTTTAKPGKHGSAKVILKGKDFLTDKVYDGTLYSGGILFPHSQIIDVLIDDKRVILYRFSDSISPQAFDLISDSTSEFLNFLLIN